MMPGPVKNGAGLSGVRLVCRAQEADKPERARPLQVGGGKGRAYIARVASPAEGAAMLADRLARGDVPRGRWSIRRKCGLWEVRLMALCRGGRRKPWLRHFPHFCEAVRGLREMRAVSDALEKRLLGEAAAALGAVAAGEGPKSEGSD